MEFNTTLICIIKVIAISILIMLLSVTVMFCLTYINGFILNLIKRGKLEYNLNKNIKAGEIAVVIELFILVVVLTAYWCCCIK